MYIFKIYQIHYLFSLIKKETKTHFKDVKTEVQRHLVER